MTGAVDDVSEEELHRRRTVEWTLYRPVGAEISSEALTWDSSTIWKSRRDGVTGLLGRSMVAFDPMRRDV